MKTKKFGKIFEAGIWVNFRMVTEDFDTEEEAVDVVEKAGSGTVTGFYLTPNRPGCLPEVVANSTSLRTFKNGTWRDVNIFGG